MTHPNNPKSPNRNLCYSHDQTQSSLFSNKLSHFKGFINVQIEQEQEQVFVSPSFIHWRWHGFFIQWLTSRKADVDCKPPSEDALDLLLQGWFLFIYLFLSLSSLCWETLVSEVFSLKKSKWNSNTASMLYACVHLWVSAIYRPSRVQLIHLKTGDTNCNSTHRMKSE